MFQKAAVLPVSHVSLLPQVSTTLSLNPKSAEYASLFVEDQDTYIALQIRRHVDSGTRTLEDFCDTGVTFRISEISEGSKSTSLKIRTEERVRIERLYMEEGVLKAEYSVEDDIADLDEKSLEDMMGYIKNVVSEISDALKAGAAFKRSIDLYTQLNPLIVYLCKYMQISDEERFELLQIRSLKERSLKFIDYLMRQKEAIKLNMEVNEKFSQRANKAYREQALRAQLKVIQDELNGSDDDASEDDKSWKARIEKAGLPEEVYKVAMEEARKLESQNNGGMETGVIEKYLDFILALPWKEEESREINLPEARDILDADHYGLKTVKTRILQHLAVMALKHENKGSALLLVGPPGTGKTSLGKSIARALGREYVRMSLGGMRDEAEIRGHRRTYVGAMPGRILESIKRAGTKNPVMVLDEIDKLANGGFSGDPASALLEVLDPAQNNTFTDHYLDLPYDLSEVFFIATANSLDSIPGPLLDRMEVIEISGYTPDEKFHIAREHLLPDVLEETGLKEGQMVISDDILMELISEYTSEAGVRGLRKQLAKLARSSAEKVLMDPETKRIEITKKDLQDLLGNRVARHQKAGEQNPPGVVTGLAWTPVGGEILFIETTDMPGTGNVTITGQLGDVMKESAQISLSLLKSRLPLDTAVFKDRDLHIHVPNGSTPKDGPSAGITLFTALASLVTGRQVSSQLAMTGEITLRGDVMPIGGLREKLYGAQRAGITKVLIPYDNKEDLKDVAPEVLEKLEIVPVKTVEDVLHEALGIELPRIEHMLMDVSFGMSGSAL